MITLYGSPATRAHRVIWMLQELKLEYSLEPLDREDPTHRALNPNAKVPILADGDFVLWESIAINLDLASRYGGGLQPASDQGRWHAPQWSLWGVAEVRMRLSQVRASKVARRFRWLPVLATFWHSSMTMTSQWHCSR